MLNIDKQLMQLKYQITFIILHNFDNFIKLFIYSKNVVKNQFEGKETYFIIFSFQWIKCDPDVVTTHVLYGLQFTKIIYN